MTGPITTAAAAASGSGYGTITGACQEQEDFRVLVFVFCIKALQTILEFRYVQKSLGLPQE